MDNLEKNLEELDFFKKNQERRTLKKLEENTIKNPINDVFVESIKNFSIIINYYFHFCIVLFGLHVYMPSVMTQDKCLELLSFFGTKLFPLLLISKLIYESISAIFKSKISLWTPIKNTITYGTLIAINPWIIQHVSTIFSSIWNSYLN